MAGWQVASTKKDPRPWPLTMRHGGGFRTDNGDELLVDTSQTHNTI